jgi:hypothetical protein
MCSHDRSRTASKPCEPTHASQRRSPEAPPRRKARPRGRSKHEARHAHRSRREKVSGGRRSAQVVCSSIPHSRASARALVRLARSMAFQGQIKPSHSVREQGRRCHEAQRRRTRAPAAPTIFIRCVVLACTSATSGTRIWLMPDGLTAARLLSAGREHKAAITRKKKQ